jgi:hypothetical protein
VPRRLILTIYQLGGIFRQTSQNPTNVTKEEAEARWVPEYMAYALAILSWWHQSIVGCLTHSCPALSAVSRRFPYCLKQRITSRKKLFTVKH